MCVIRRSNKTEVAVRFIAKYLREKGETPAKFLRKRLGVSHGEFETYLLAATYALPELYEYRSGRRGSVILGMAK